MKTWPASAGKRGFCTGQDPRICEVEHVLLSTPNAEPLTDDALAAPS